MKTTAQLTYGATGPRVDLLELDPAATDANAAMREPIRRLADATLWAAIQDAYGDDEEHAHTATRWLLGDATEGFSLEACCTRLGFAPDSVLNSVERSYPTIRRRVADYRRIALLQERFVDSS